MEQEDEDMLFAEIGTQKRKIGRMELVNLGCGRGGKTRYMGSYANQDGVRLEFQLTHKRSDGALRLMELAFKMSRKLLEEFYSYPEEKVKEYGLLKASDVPERWRAAFGRWLGVATVSILDGETAYNLRDVDGFLENRKNGFVMAFD